MGGLACPKQMITSLTGTAVDVACGDGTILRYQDRDETNTYQGPGGTGDSLEYDSDKATWIQTAADGSVVPYRPDGRADYLASPAGDRWTLSYDGDLLKRVGDPFPERSPVWCTTQPENDFGGSFNRAGV